MNKIIQKITETTSLKIKAIQWTSLNSVSSNLFENQTDCFTIWNIVCPKTCMLPRMKKEKEN